MLLAIVILITLTAVVSWMGGIVASSQRDNTRKSQDGYQQLFDKLKPDQEEK